MSTEKVRFRASNTGKVFKEISDQIDHQRAVLKHRPHVISSKMTSQEAFDAYSKTDEFKIFIDRMTQRSYSLPRDWNNFRTSVLGRLNEMMTVDMVSNSCYNRLLVLDSEHSKRIIQALFPTSRVREHGKKYGIESCSIRDGSIHLPSPDYMIIEGNYIHTFGETSLSSRKDYWTRKKTGFQSLNNYFRYKVPPTFNRFKPDYADMTLTQDAFRQRKKLNLTGNNPPIITRKLPYTRKEFEEFCSDYIPKLPPVAAGLNNRHQTSWKDLIDIDEVTLV